MGEDRLWRALGACTASAERQGADRAHQAGQPMMQGAPFHGGASRAAVFWPGRTSPVTGASLLVVTWKLSVTSSPSFRKSAASPNSSLLGSGGGRAGCELTDCCAHGQRACTRRAGMRPQRRRVWRLVSPTRTEALATALAPTLPLATRVQSLQAGFRQQAGSRVAGMQAYRQAVSTMSPGCPPVHRQLLKRVWVHAVHLAAWRGGAVGAAHVLAAGREGTAPGRRRAVPLGQVRWRAGQQTRLGLHRPASS